MENKRSIFQNKNWKQKLTTKRTVSQVKLAGPTKSPSNMLLQNVNGLLTFSKRLMLRVPFTGKSKFGLAWSNKPFSNELEGHDTRWGNSVSYWGISNPILTGTSTKQILHLANMNNKKVKLASLIASCFTRQNRWKEEFVHKFEEASCLYTTSACQDGMPSSCKGYLAGGGFHVQNISVWSIFFISHK